MTAEYGGLYPSAPGILVDETQNSYADYSNAAEGYITALYRGDSSKSCKIEIVYGIHSQKFAVPSDGTAKVFPLCFGNGDYSVRMLRQVEGNKYVQIARFNIDVKLRNEFVPFLHPNTYADYGRESRCVKTASNLCLNQKTEVNKLTEIYRWITDNVEYDTELAGRVQTETWWLPEPDKAIDSGKTICFGYASLFAAMCRSQGIPTKIAVRDVKSGGLHAWNEVYVKEHGNVDGISLKAGNWTRLDITFMDNSSGKISNFVSDDKNYAVKYYG